MLAANGSPTEQSGDAAQPAGVSLGGIGVRQKPRTTRVSPRPEQAFAHGDAIADNAHCCALLEQSDRSQAGNGNGRMMFDGGSPRIAR